MSRQLYTVVMQMEEAVYATETYTPGRSTPYLIPSRYRQSSRRPSVGEGERKERVVDLDLIRSSEVYGKG